MKRGIKLIFLVLFFLSCNSNKEIINNSYFFLESDCNDEINQAKEDYKNGIKKYIILGLVEADEFQIYYNDYMFNKYNIRVEASCNPNFKEECYSIVMEDEIINEFGENFISKTYKEARRKFKRLNKKSSN